MTKQGNFTQRTPQTKKQSDQASKQVSKQASGSTNAPHDLSSLVDGTIPIGKPSNATIKHGRSTALGLGLRRSSSEVLKFGTPWCQSAQAPQTGRLRGRRRHVFSMASPKRSTPLRGALVIFGGNAAELEQHRRQSNDQSAKSQQQLQQSEGLGGGSTSTPLDMTPKEILATEGLKLSKTTSNAHSGEQRCGEMDTASIIAEGVILPMNGPTWPPLHDKLDELKWLIRSPSPYNALSEDLGISGDTLEVPSRPRDAKNSRRRRKLSPSTTPPHLLKNATQSQLENNDRDISHSEAAKNSVQAQSALRPFARRYINCGGRYHAEMSITCLARPTSYGQKRAIGLADVCGLHRTSTMHVLKTASPLHELVWKVNPYADTLPVLLDALRGIHQIQMAKMSWKRQLFHTVKVSIYTMMPFGLKECWCQLLRLVRYAFRGDKWAH
ncbi:hypothetical protein Tco_0025067 [Tanacetum coccineum]